MMRTLSFGPALAGLAVATVLGLGGSARAMTISGLSITNNSTTPSTGAAADSGVSQGAQVLSSSATSFETRYRTTGSADVGAFGSAASRNT
jgi:hypothetical protein